jgi:tRNA uridine 5-carboxymethylaminomethyl modification enzyme
LRAGCVSDERKRRFEESRLQRQAVEDRLATAFTGSSLVEAGIGVRDDGVRRPLADWLRFPELDRDGLIRLVPELDSVPEAALDEAIQDHRYAPYIARQQSEVARLRSDESVRIPAALDYRAIAGLSNEMVERLTAARPATLGAASRIRGITPAALAAILVQSRRKAA